MGSRYPPNIAELRPWGNERLGAPADALEELDLPGVVGVVHGDAENRIAVAPGPALADAAAEPGSRKTLHDFDEQAMLLRDQLAIGRPGCVVGPLRHRRPIGWSTRKARKCHTQDSPPDHVVPIGDVQRQLPDGVSAAGRTPARQGRVDAAQRTRRGRAAMPGKPAARLQRPRDRRDDRGAQLSASRIRASRSKGSDIRSSTSPSGVRGHSSAGRSQVSSSPIPSGSVR